MNTNLSGNSRTRFTRMCIAEAIIELMQNEDFARIRISDIAAKAGVSRKTFYNYYDSSYLAITDYLQEIIREYLEESSSNPLHGSFLEYEHILFSLHFFDRYRHFFLTLTKQKLETVLLDGINQFMITNFSESLNHTIYEMYCYSGGLLNVFLRWEEGGKTEPPEKIARIIYDLYNSKL